MIVVVTGMSRGLGRAVAQAFAAEGHTVVGCARSADTLGTVAEEIEADTGSTVETMRCDVRDEHDLERLLETASRESDDGIDVLVPNAGVYHGGGGETPLPEESYSSFDDHLRTNARGVFGTIKEALPHLADDARVLVPTGSIAREAKPGYGSYAVSKAAAEAIVRGIAVDTDVPVGCLDLGLLGTGLASADGTPEDVQGRDPEDVAPMFLWASVDVPAEDLDGGVIDLREWKTATR
jgi:NAD(P)-dependent dehydrogenase (short-subunit alcohol dehydrogenase family)